MKNSPTVGVIVGVQYYRHPPEIALYNCSDLKVKFVGSDPKPWFDKGQHEFVSTPIEKTLPDFVSRILVRKPYGPVSFIRLKKGFENFLIEVDIINCVELYAFISRQCAKLAKKHKKKLVVTVYETISHMPYYVFPPFSFNTHFVSKQADAIIATSNEAVKALRSLSIPQGKIALIYPGVDTEKFSVASSRKNRDRLRILYVGRLDPEKGIYYLLEAFAKLSEKRKNVELWLCGIPRTHRVSAVVKSYADKYAVYNCGFVSREELPKIYSQCDIFCLPSFDRKKFGVKVWEEQFGFAVVEAMSCGLPIVATDCGAIPEIIGQENLVVKQKSVDAFYSAFTKLIDDDDLRYRLGCSNRSRAETLFNIKRQACKVQELFFQLSNS
jgi:glycosyltransferase involved in cell wall biosynthesis